MSSTGLHVLVIGAGLAGLASAVALRREGHEVEIFERSQFANEVGAAISCPRNVTRILKVFGYKPSNLRPVELKMIKMYTHDKVAGPFRTIPVAPDTKEHEYPSYQVHRVDLHNELRRLALDPQGEGTPCKLHLRTLVKDCSPANRTITLRDGRTIRGDLIIISDGIHSALRTHVLGHPAVPVPSGFFCYRFVIPMADLVNDPALDWLTEDQSTVRVAVDGKHRRIVVYPCRDGTLLNCAAIYDDRKLDPRDIDMEDTVPVQEVLDVFGDFHPRYLHLLGYAKTVRIWPLYKSAPFSTWVNGQTCLIGDAAHPMLPHVAQGGAQSIEDAATLGALLPRGTPGSEVNARLRLFESVRKPRCTAFQTIGLKTAEGEPMPVGTDTSTRSFVTWAYDYDAIAVAKNALQ